MELPAPPPRVPTFVLIVITKHIYFPIMKKRDVPFLIVALLCSSFISSVCYGQFGLPKVSSTKNITVHLRDIDPLFVDFEGKSDFDGILDSISYIETGKGNYDEVFKDVALLSATTTQISYALKQIQDAPERFLNKKDRMEDRAFGFLESVNAMTLLSPSAAIEAVSNATQAYQKLSKAGASMGLEPRFAYTVILYSIKFIPSVRERVKSVTTALASLKIKDDFSGADATNVPKVTSSVSNSQSKATASLDGTKDIVQRLTAVLKQMNGGQTAVPAKGNKQETKKKK